MRRLIMLAALLLLTACTQSPAAVEQAPTVDAPPAAQQPATPNEQDAPGEVVRPSADPKSAFTAWLVDPFGERPAEEVFFRAEPLHLLTTSPDGRFWLLHRTVVHPVWELAVYDRESETLHEVGELYPRFLEASWHDGGFELGNLHGVQQEASGQWRLVEHGTYQDLLGLADGEVLVAFTMTPDRQMAAAIVQQEGANADLVVVQSGSGEPLRVRGAISPWPFAKAGPHARLAISPDSSRLALIAPAPGTALIDTAKPQREHWVAPLEPFVALYSSWTEITSSGPPGGPVWAADSTQVWLPGGTVVSRDGAVVTAEGAPKPNDGLVHPSGKVWQESAWTWVLQTPDGQRRNLDLASGILVHRFMPDGRLLVTMTRVY